MSNALLLALGVTTTGCDFLDIVPPEQVTLKDATSNVNETENFLYSCYAFIHNPIEYNASTASADEFALPESWGGNPYNFACDLITPANSGNDQRWNRFYDGIGQCHLFLRELPNAIGVNEEQKAEWEAEAKFMLAYYHFEVLRFYGPCPITSEYLPFDTPNSEFPGRSHYDAVTEYIVDLLDEVIQSGKLPLTRDENERGRATQVIAYGLKARALLYAASPLWNGSFPYRNWKNKINSSYDSVDYGKELVSLQYDPKKWERARIACEEALTEALNAGHVLCKTNAFDHLITDKMYDQVYAPMNNDTNDKQAERDFKHTVLFYRYLSCTQVKEGNTELVWGLSKDDDYMIWACLMPYHVIQKTDGNWISGYEGYSPYLGSMESFYNADGSYYKRSSDELTRWADNPDGERADVINLAVDREPRFYAWMAFDQGNWGTLIQNGKALKLEMKKSGRGYQGYAPDLFTRDHCVTGFLCQKFIRPDRSYSTNGSVNSTNFQRPLMRTSELYLNLAECYAMEGNITDALKNLNAVHTRGGLPEITENDLDEHSLMEYIRNERFIEFFGEGQRFFDVRRWCLGEEYLSKGKREGLNAETVTNPDFSTFNRRIDVNQPYKWTDRMYIAPVYQSEIGKNEQLVQAPGY